MIKFFLLIVGNALGFVARGPSPAPAASPAGPAGVSSEPVQAVKCTFHIENLDYGDLMKNEEAQEGVRNAVISFVDHATEAALAAPAAAPGAAPPAGPAAAGAFVQSRLRHFQLANAPAPAPAAAPTAPNNVQVFATVSEGAKDSVEVEAWAVAPPASLSAVEASMQDCCTDKGMAQALLGAEGVQWKHLPVISGALIGSEAVERFDIDCGPHVDKIVDRFTLAYTRRQVPDAIDAACHLFESKLSFSGNRRITKWDRMACHKATVKLMKQWQGGKGKQDYDQWCHDICELKLGVGAPHCHI